MSRNIAAYFLVWLRVKWPVGGRAILLGCVLFVAAGLTKAWAAEPPCETFLAVEQIPEVVPPLRVAITQAPSMFRDGVITSEMQVPTAMVLASLGLEFLVEPPMVRHLAVTRYRAFGNAELAKELENSFQTNADRSWLSLGEGCSGLVPFASKRGFDIYGLDLWYGQDLEIVRSTADYILLKTYWQKFGPLLLAGDATDLRRVRFRGIQGIPSETFQYVTSNMMFHFLRPEFKIEAFAEALRVTKRGGFVVISAPFEEFDIVRDLLRDQMDPRYYAIEAGEATVDAAGDLDSLTQKELRDVQVHPLVSVVRSAHEPFIRIVIRRP